MADPRLYQIATLASLLVYGMGWLDFDITVSRVVLLLATVLATQGICDRLVGAPPFGSSARSALISGLSLCLLLRTNRAELAVLAAIVTIASKFLIRFHGKHVFNPTNGGIVAMLLLTNQVWVSPGQWGSAAFFALLHGLRRRLVVNRAARVRRDVRVHRLLLRAAVRPVAVSRRAADDSAAPARERRAAAVHLLHDFRSEDDARLAARAACCSRRSSPSARGTCSSGCSGRTACSGRWPRARRSCRSSIAVCPAHATRGPSPKSTSTQAPALRVA